MLDFLKKTESVKENYWALLIEPEWITSCIWNIENGKVNVVVSSPPTRWEVDLVDPVDASLSACTQNLPEDFPDPSKTVFGLPNNWIDGGNIKDEYLEKLKKICDSLSLVPSGFVVLSEAMSHYIKNEEGSGFSGVAIGFSSESIDLSIFNLGKLVGNTNVARSISIEEDVEEGLTRLSPLSSEYPPRIIIYNQSDSELEEIKSVLDSSDWDKLSNSKFIHTPRVEVFDPSKKILAVALAGGSEIGEVNGIKNDDNLDSNISTEEIENFEKPDNITAEDLGFTVSNKSNTVDDNQIETVPIALKDKFKIKRPNIKLPNINFRLPAFKSGRPLVMIGSLILTLLVTGILLWWFLPKATVTIYVSPKVITDSLAVEVDGGVKTEKIEVEVDGEKTKATTGIKTVGEKAKGSVKIQNGTAFPINLSVGTALVSSSDLKFLTLKTASVSGALSPSSPGTATVEVEASSIGSEFNLSKDEVFKVSNYPKAEVDATSAEAFAGGSSRQISAVSDDDKKKIYKELVDELSETAKQKLQEKVTEDYMLIDSSVTLITTEENYSNKVGDEATNLKLSLFIKAEAVIVSKAEITNLAKKSLEDKVPSGFSLRDDQIKYEFDESEDKKSFDMQISANLLPSINTSEISKKIAGRYPKVVEEYLVSVPGFVNAEITMKPTLQGKLGTLPHLSKNITIEIESE